MSAEDYVQYGKEWEAALMLLTKPNLIKMLRMVCSERDAARPSQTQLQPLVDALREIQTKADYSGPITVTNLDHILDGIVDVADKALASFAPDKEGDS